MASQAIPSGDEAGRLPRIRLRVLMISRNAASSQYATAISRNARWIR